MHGYTRKQKAVLEFVAGDQREQGISPTLEESGEALGITRVTAFQHVKSLEKKGAITTKPLLSRSIEIQDPDYRPDGRSLPILGRIAAGSPIDEIEDREEFDPEEFFPANEGYFLLRVRGNSMIGDQIRDGDLVLVEPRASADDGEMVVAIVDEENATLKRFYKDDGFVRLEASNSAYEAICVEDCRIEGVVVGVVRKL